MNIISIKSFLGSQVGIFMFAFIFLICGISLFKEKSDIFGTAKFCGGISIIGFIVSMFLGIFYNSIF